MRPLPPACLLVAACSFDPAALRPVDGGGGAADAAGGDGGPVDARSDAGTCPAPIVAEAQVNGGGGSPTVLVGDSVRFTAIGSCVQDGPATLIWTLSPADGTLLTRDGDDFDFTVYSVIADQPYVVTLEVFDGGGASVSTTRQAFTTRGFERLDGTLTGDDLVQRGLSVGGGMLWIGTKHHAFAMPLDAPGLFADLSATWAGADVPDDIDETFYDAPSNRVWFAANASAARVWRGDVALEAFTPVPYDMTLGGSTAVNDIHDAPTGIYLATGRGVTQSLTGASFAGVVSTTEFFSVLVAPARTWAGGAALVDLDMPTFTAAPYGSGDNKIRNMALDPDGRLWLASDDQGVARVDGATGAVEAVYAMADGAPANRARSLAVETSGPFAGDVWFATDNGVGRWKKDRDAVITLAAPAGLSQRLNGNWIVFTAFGGGRTIYQSTSTGLVYAHLP